MRNSRNLAHIVNNEFKFHTGSSIFIAGDDGTRAFHSNAAVGDVVVATCASSDVAGVFSSRPIISEKSRNNSSKSSAGGGGGGGPLGVLG